MTDDEGDLLGGDHVWLRTIPGLTVVVPSDPEETAQVLRWAAGHDGPVFVRVSRMGVPDVNPPGYEFVPGRAVTLRDGSDVTLIANGTTVTRALDAAELLAAEDIPARVLSMPTLKPLDEDAVVAAARDTQGIVTVEEALTVGLGGAVAETVVRHRPVPVRFVGVSDAFAPMGSVEWLLDHFGINAEGIAARARDVIER